VPGAAASIVAALALAAGQPQAPAYADEAGTSWRARNAARARSGLLPRKPPAKRPRAVDRRGRRLLRLATPPPTFLDAPAVLADVGGTTPDASAEPARWVEEAPAPALRAVAGGVETELAVSPRRPPLQALATGVETRASLRPRPPAAVAASGVQIEVSLTLRLD
jgi:hypothetical protein